MRILSLSALFFLASLLLQFSESRADERILRLGQVTIDNHQATVTFDDEYELSEIYRVTVSLTKTEESPPIKSKRVQVWLLATSGTKQLMIPGFYHSQPFFPDRKIKGKTISKGFYYFDSRWSGGQPRMVVVVVDGKPTTFTISRGKTTIAPEVVAAWKKAGASYFSGRKLESYQFDFYGDPYGFLNFPPGFSPKNMSIEPGTRIPLPKIPFSLNLYLGKEQFPQVPGLSKAKGLNLGGKITKADWKELTKLKKVETLWCQTSFSTEEFQNLGKFPNLRCLWLSNTNLSDESLKFLPKLKKLRSLDASNYTITDNAIKQIKKLPELRLLGIYTTKVTDKGIADLVSLKNLKVLHIGSTKVTGKVFAQLVKLKHLEALSLTNCKLLEDEDFLQLAKLKSLQYLDISSTKVGDKGIRGIAGLRNLLTLDISNTKISDQGCRHLVGLEKLQILNLSNTHIGNGATKHVANLKNLRKLVLYPTKVSDAGMKELWEMKQLKFIDISERVSRKSLQLLRKKLPWTLVYGY